MVKYTLIDTYSTNRNTLSSRKRFCFLGYQLQYCGRQVVCKEGSFLFDLHPKRGVVPYFRWNKSHLAAPQCLQEAAHIGLWLCNALSFTVDPQTCRKGIDYQKNLRASFGDNKLVKKGRTNRHGERKRKIPSWLSEVLFSLGKVVRKLKKNANPFLSNLAQILSFFFPLN